MDSFCYYCQRDFGARLAQHLRSKHPNTYAAERVVAEPVRQGTIKIIQKGGWLSDADNAIRAYEEQVKESDPSIRFYKDFSRLPLKLYELL